MIRGALTFLKGINPLLAKYQKREKGISKPDEHALKNTDDLYSLIGRPLDYIPTIHVAGTNGKVFISRTILWRKWTLTRLDMTLREVHLSRYQRD